MKTHLSILFILASIFCFSQTKKQRLLVAEYRIDSPRAGNYTYLVSYNVGNGTYISKDTIFQAPVFKKGVIKGSYVRYDLGKNFIYKNRYVIAANGAVIDTKKRCLVREQSDHFVEELGDTLIFYRNNIYIGTGYLSLDLKTGNYEFIKDSTWYKPKKYLASPDGKHYISIDKRNIPYKVCLNDENGNRKILVQDAGHGPYTIDTQFPTIETHWLDNKSFLYAVHKPQKDLLGNILYQVTIHRYNIEHLTDVVFFVFDSIAKPKVAFNGSFFIDAIGQTIYKATSGKSYIVDTANQILSETKFSQLGYKFSSVGNKDGINFQYKNHNIGTLWCIEPTVSDGVIAVMYGEAGSNLGYPKGLGVWTQSTQKWKTIDIPWISNIIGWIYEE